MKKTIWVFEKSKWYWFVVPNDKKNHNWDYYISEKNFFWAKDWDLVEIEILKTNKGKSKEAKIINILNKGKKENLETIIWIYSQAKDWQYWFVDVIDLPKGYFVHPKNKLTAMDWDTVEAFVKDFNWRQEAEIIRVLERKKWLIVWVYQQSKGNFWFVIPKNENIKNDIFVASTNAFWARSGDIVWVEITKFTAKNPEWVIKEIISKKWNLDKREEEILTIAVEMWAKITFPEEALNNLKNVSEKIEEIIGNEEYLRRMGEDFKEFTDILGKDKKYDQISEDFDFWII